MKAPGTEACNSPITLDTETIRQTAKLVIIIAILTSLLILLGCQKYSMYVTVVPNETSGSIELAPDPDSEGRYKKGMEVRLRAVPGTNRVCEEPSWVFLGWDGDASGSFPTALIQMDGDRHITAEFGCDSSAEQE